MKETQFPERISSIVKLVALAIILLGLILRVQQYCANRSLWLDEAFLALNLVERDLVELVQPLDYNQGAPLGFLYAQKLTIQVLGNRDYILRLLPLAAGVISLYLFYRVAEKYASRAAMLLALALYAASGPLVYYTSEAKQYSTDVATTLLLLLLAAKCFEAEVGMKHYVGLGVAGSLALWFSHPALFVVAGIGLSLALHQVTHRDWRRLSWLGMACLLWLANFAAIYAISLHSLASNTDLINYWAGGFMPVPPWRDFGWFPNAFSDMLENLAGLSATSIAMVAFFVGCLSLLLRRWRLGLVLIVPFGLVLLASGLKKYPFADRLLLFIVPSALLLIAQGADQIRVSLRRVSHWLSNGVWLFLTIVLLLAPTVGLQQTLWHPQMREEIKQVMRYVDQHFTEGDLLYVYYGAKYPFLYYAPQFGFGEEDYMLGLYHREEPHIYLEELDQLSGGGRIWFIFSHVYNWAAIDEEAFFLEHLDSLGTRVDVLQAPGASTYLYDLGTRGQ